MRQPLASKSLALTTLFAAALVGAGCESPPVSGGAGGTTGGSAGGRGGSTGGSAAGRGGSAGGTTGGSGPSTGGTTGGGTGGTTGGTGGSAGTTGGTGGSAGTTGGTGGSTGGTGGSMGGTGGRADGGAPERAPDMMTAPAGDGGIASDPGLNQRCTVPITFQNQAMGSAGGDAFAKEFPDIAATMQAHARTICNILYRKVDEVKNVTRQGLTIDMHDGVAFASGGNINFSATYIGSYVRGKTPAQITMELNGVLVHESAHVWQYTNGGGWLVEAMADYVRYKAGFDRIQRRQRGGNWNQPYTTGGFFIHWIEEKYDKDFGYKVNMGMRERNFSYPALVQQVTGKPVDTVWQEYQRDI